MFNRMRAALIILAVFTLISSAYSSPTPCTSKLFRDIDTIFVTQDSQGHGPDLGSQEWFYVIDKRIKKAYGIKLPNPGSKQWCAKVDRLIQRPSFECKPQMKKNIEALICNDRALSLLDSKLAYRFTLAMKTVTGHKKKLLRAEQRGWIKGRNDCWKSNNETQCVSQAYQLRIAEISARYNLVPSTNPVTFVCQGQKEKLFSIIFYETNPATLIAEHDGKTVVMYIRPSASGTHYSGPNEQFWEHQGEAIIQWGFEAPKLECRKR